MTPRERDYVLGTHDDEIERLGLQHEVWRPRAMAAWQRAGFFPANVADGAWCRWVLAFVMRPRELLAKAAAAIKPGGTFTSHEYFDYASWRSLPPSPLFAEFVQTTIRNWRSSGGEPDIGLEIPRWLEELGFTIESTTPIVDVITPRDFTWPWPTSFMQVGLRRLIDLGVIDAGRETEFREALDAVATDPSMRMTTPAVLEVVARKV